MTETKLATSDTTNLSLTNPLYLIYTSNCNTQTAKKRESSLGTAIGLQLFLQPYIYDIWNLFNTAILIDFFLPYHNRTRIISIYLLSNNQPLSHETQTTISDWIKQAKATSMKIIVLWDFNDNILSFKRTWFSPLLYFMSINHMFRMISYFNIGQATWTRAVQKSQIDDTWTLLEIIIQCSNIILTASTDITNMIPNSSYLIHFPRKKGRRLPGKSFYTIRWPRIPGEISPPTLLTEWLN